MTNILVVFEQVEGKISKGSLVALSAAQKLKSKWQKQAIIGLVMGSKAAVAADNLLDYGLSEVYFSENQALEKYLAIPYTQAVLEAGNLSAADTLVSASSSTGKDFLPRVAALWEAGQATDIVDVNDDGSLRRPMYAGNVIADVSITTAKKVISVRTTAFAPAEKASKVGSKKELSLSFDLSKAGQVLSYDKKVSSRPELGDAAIIVSGGRALKSSENFMKYMGELADAFGAAIGASRAAVDSGYAPNDWQVGQTGKVVAPQLYVAVGISGAIQHLAGMKDSKVIVAINNDKDAPIYEVADYGLVADLYQAVPELTAAVKKVRST